VIESTVTIAPVACSFLPGLRRTPSTTIASKSTCLGCRVHRRHKYFLGQDGFALKSVSVLTFERTDYRLPLGRNRTRAPYESLL
jgi:hypothetical protein